MVYDIIRVKKYSLTWLSQICDGTKCVKKTLLALLHLSWLVHFLPVTLLLQWRVRVYKEMFSVNIKIAQTMQNSLWTKSLAIWNFIVRKSSLLKKWQTSGIICEISYSNLETRRYGPNLKSPRLSRRVDSTDNWVLFEL